ncbi:MAG: hypothetical protein WCV93_00265 [Candidatus Shapirobacteria bacterium]|jgi:hypothetical protein
MSTLIIKYKSDTAGSFIEKNGEELRVKLVKITSEVLNKRPEEIIVDMETWHNNINVPDLLVRAETSISRRSLLKEWAEKLHSEIKMMTEEHKPECGWKIAVKSYVIDSEWVE